MNYNLMNLSLKLTTCLFLTFLYFGIVTFAKAQSVEKTSLDGSWKFKIDPYGLGQEEGWFENHSQSGNWDLMEVPGNWDVRNEYAHYTGKAWYQKTFILSEEWRGKNINIHFDAVSHDAIIWINGQLVGSNDTGFMSFEYDITSQANLLEVNTITVEVDNTKKIGAIWNWGGIRRSVYLTASDGIRLLSHHITPVYDYQTNSAEVHCKLRFQSTTSSQRDLKGEVRIQKDGNLIKTLPFISHALVYGVNEIDMSTKLEGKEVKPWHFDSPHLYTAELIMHGSDIPIEVTRFGLRKIELDEAKKQLLINGEPIRAMGFNLVPDDRTTGNTLPLWRIKEDIDLIKEAGGNLARLSHLPLPKEALDYMDERGIMTFSEIPLWGFDPLADPESEVSREWLIRLIDSQYNHPCIIGWNVGNEIGDYPETYEYVRQAIDLAKSLDSTRMATAVSHTAHRPNDFLIHSDLGFINKYGSNLLPVTEIQHKNFPNKILFYTEYGISQFGEDINSDFDIKSLIDPLRNLPYLIGASIWTFNDYRSNYFGTKEHSENRSWGVVDVFRRKKRAFFSIRKEHAPIRNLEVVSKGSKSILVTITPRAILDLPSYILRDYKLVWQIEDSKRNILEAGWENLPEIRPGTNNLERSIAWKTGGEFKLQVKLLTPQNDQVSDAVFYFQSPEIVSPLGVFGGRMLQNDIRPNSANIRVFLDENLTSVFHTAKIKIGNEVKEIGAIYENFIDIQNLDFSTPYELEVFAVNAAGETSILNQNVEINPKMVVPPAVRHIETAKNGFFVGYATELDDFQFRVRYSKEKDLENNSKTVTTTNPGLIFIPVMATDQPYYFQIQRVKDNNYYSDWSIRYEVPIGEVLKPLAPTLKGVTRQKSEALVHFEPVKKAIGYQLEYREINSKAKDWSGLSLSRSMVHDIFVEGLNPKIAYEFRMSAITEEGQSDYSLVLKK